VFNATETLTLQRVTDVADSTLQTGFVRYLSKPNQCSGRVRQAVDERYVNSRFTDFKRIQNGIDERIQRLNCTWICPVNDEDEVDVVGWTELCQFTKTASIT
jgi:hypothetical protein